MLRFGIVVLLVGCGGQIDLSVETPEDVAELCDRIDPDPVTLTVSFPARPPGCPWGEGDNLPMAQGVVTARSEETFRLDIPDEAVVCGLTFDFQVDPEVEPEMIYDDHMFFLFNDVILAASNRDMVAPMPESGGLPVWDWLSLAGSTFNFFGNPVYCLGDEDGRSDCTIPDSEQRGTLLLRYDDDLVDELSLLASRQDRRDFGFVVVGDNDPDQDCSHEAFSFNVDVPYVSN